MFAELIQVYFEKTVTSLKSNAFFANVVLLVRLTSTERRKRHLTDDVYTQLRVMPAGIAERETEDGEPDVDKSASIYGPTSSDLMTPENLSCTNLENTGKKTIRVLDKAMLHLLKSFERAPKSGF